MKRKVKVMNSTAKNVIIFVSGLVAGAAAGVFGTRAYWKKHYEEVADAEIDEMSNYYQGKMHEMVNFFDGDEVNPEEENSEQQNETEEDKDPKMDPEKAADIKEKLTRNHEQTTNYATMYKKKTLTKEDLEENAPEYGDVENDETLEDQSDRAIAERATEDHQANMNRPPKIISEDALGEIPAYYDNAVLFYYDLDDTVTDEDDNIIDEPGHLIGDCLDKYNFRDSKEQIIFVRNYALDTIYEIQKLHRTFEYH
jgi:hypothetical protein